MFIFVYFVGIFAASPRSFLTLICIIFWDKSGLKVLKSPWCFLDHLNHFDLFFMYLFIFISQYCNFVASLFLWWSGEMHVSRVSFPGSLMRAACMLCWAPSRRTSRHRTWGCGWRGLWSRLCGECCPTDRYDFKHHVSSLSWWHQCVVTSIKHQLLGKKWVLSVDLI